MKVARFVLKIVGLCLGLAAAVCCVIAYWDKITEGIQTLGEKMGCRFARVPSEYRSEERRVGKECSISC